MIRLPNAPHAWGTPGFNDILKRELEQLDSDQLPLQQGLSTCSHVAGEGFKVMVIKAADAGDFIRARVGIFYAGIIAGCSCADDPTPVEAQSEYCEVQLDIDRRTGETTVALLA